MRARIKKAGRKRGSSNKAGFYPLNTTTRKGWYTSHKGRVVQLLDESGSHIKDPSAVDEARVAYARFITVKNEQEKLGIIGQDMLVAEICRQYIEAVSNTSTKATRQRFLFDFVTGYSGKFATNGKTPTAKDRIHQGYGDKTASSIIVKDVHDWTRAHKGWNDGGARRGGIQAVKRAFNWAKEMGLIAVNPL